MCNGSRCITMTIQSTRADMLVERTAHTRPQLFSHTRHGSPDYAESIFLPDRGRFSSYFSSLHFFFFFFEKFLIFLKIFCWKMINQNEVANGKMKYFNKIFFLFFLSFFDFFFFFLEFCFLFWENKKVNQQRTCKKKWNFFIR